MISGKRIALRPWQRDDIDAFMRWFNDPEVTQYLAIPYPCVTREAEEAFYEKAAKEPHHYCIVTQPQGRLIGNCAFHDLDLTHRSAEVGIVIGEKDAWNQGYGREALAMMLEIGFQGLGLHRIQLQYGAFNQRGEACYRAAGFREEGRRRDAWFVSGAYHDLVLMSMLDDEYRSSARQKPPLDDGAQS